MLIRNRTKVFAAAVLSAALGAGAVWAQAPGFGRRDRASFLEERGEKLKAFLAAYLDLTASQQDQAKAIFESTRQANEPVMDQLRQIRESAKAAVKSGKTEAELRQIAGGAGPLVAQAAANHLVAMSKFYNLLTLNQKEKLEKLGSGFQGFEPKEHPAK
jgi:Spy/CpxP family protein refolding chaperone